MRREQLHRDACDKCGRRNPVSFHVEPEEVGIRGLVGQMQREDGAKKVHRGMAGVLRDASYPGGLPYGYGLAPGEKRGVLQIFEPEAEVVRRMFREYAAERTPREIAGRLNRVGLRSPRGGYWNASTINGNMKRGHGILINPLYDGRMVWNQVQLLAGLIGGEAFPEGCATGRIGGSGGRT